MNWANVMRPCSRMSVPISCANCELIAILQGNNCAVRYPYPYALERQQRSGLRSNAASLFSRLHKGSARRLASSGLFSYKAMTHAFARFCSAEHSYRAIVSFYERRREG